MTEPVSSKSPRGLRRLDRGKVFWYFVLPMGVSGLLLGKYFSGVRILENIVSAPHLESVHWNSRREFGLLENLQHLILLGVAAVAGWAVVKHPVGLVRLLMGVVALGALGLFLEEIDFGLHYYEFLMEVPHEHIAEDRNFHNVGERTDVLKAVSTAGMILLFGLAPFLLCWVQNPWVQYFVPHRCFALLLVVGLITRTVAHELHDRGMGVGLEGNLSEFRELIIYYMGLLYTVYLARRSPRRKNDAADGIDGTRDAA